MKQIAMVVFTFCLLVTGVQAGESIWIDVRTVGEYQRGHKADALNIPHTIIGQKIANITTDKRAEIHLYCAAGVRAGMAKRTLERMGYTNVSNDGGLLDVQ
ncbi:MAG: hypothetical protein L3J28_05135 [Candidatus Polarisedimenticolaceae bacterium]|nr:hypothetical protein [Candidatus Polarisedimenticolaceae bacterium]